MNPLTILQDSLYFFRRNFASILTLCLPLGGFLGLLAVPDVPLIFFGLLAIGFFLFKDQLLGEEATA